MQKWLFAVFAISSIFLRLPAMAQNPLVPVGDPSFEDYRRQFAICDANNVFEKVQFPIKDSKGNTIWFDCTDQSNLVRLESVAAKGDAPSSVVFESKLAWDDDGSKESCSTGHGSTSQCGTSLMLKPSPGAACEPQFKNAAYCVPTDPDIVPYVVIPGFAPAGIDGQEFSRKTGVHVGDYGVVIYKTKIIAAIVADAGPAYKIGEGSTELLKKLSGGDVDTRRGGVVFIVFPGTKDKVDDLKLETLASIVSKKGCGLYAKIVTPAAAGSCQ